MATANQEQFWKLYKDLSPELKDAISSPATAEAIEVVCEEDGIKDERVGMVADAVGKVLLGTTLPAELPELLAKKVGLKEEIAQKISTGVNRRIFLKVRPALERMHQVELKVSPVKPALEQLYKMGLDIQKPQEQKASRESPKQGVERKALVDRYREAPE